MTYANPQAADGPPRRASVIKRWLLVVLGLTFWGLTADVFLEHYFAMRSMQVAQWVPIAFGPLAGVTALLAAWRFDMRMLRLFASASGIAVGVGLVGLGFHGWAVARQFESVRELLDLQALLAVLPHTPPLGAPGAFVGAGALGLLVHTCAVHLAHVGGGHTTRARLAFAAAFLLLVLAPLSPYLFDAAF